MSGGQGYLDDIDDAEHSLHLFKSGLRWAVISLLTCLAALLLGAGFFSGGLAVALCVVGSIGMFVSLVFGIIWMCTITDGHPSFEVRKAKRAYRNYLNSLNQEGV